MAVNPKPPRPRRTPVARRATQSPPKAAPTTPSTAAPGGRGRAGDPDLSENLQTRLDEVIQRHQDFQRHLARQLRVDAAGLATMEHLLRTGPAGPTDVARRLGISTAATTLVLDRLQAAGHLTRTPHPSDRRKVVLTAAPASAAAAQSYVDPLLRAITDLTNTMTATDQAVVVDFLDRLTAAYDRAVTELAPDPPHPVARTRADR